MGGVKFRMFAVFAVFFKITFVYADLTPEEISAMMEVNVPIVEECSKKQNMELKSMKEAKDNPEVLHCILDCLLRKIGALDENAMFDSKKLSDHVRLFVKSEDTLKGIDDVINDCSRVNDAEVNDGGKGCERAKLLFECWLEHKKKLIFM